jgi:hypothetical protein
MTRWLATYGASAALLSGGLFALGTVVLVLFYALEAPTVLASGNSDLWTPLGRTNDLLVGLSGLAAIPLAARVHDRWRTVKPWASVVVYAVALAAMLGIGVFGLISFTNLVPLTALGPFAVTALAGIGLWQLVVSLQSAEPAIHGRLRTLGSRPASASCSSSLRSWRLVGRRAWPTLRTPSDSRCSWRSAGSASWPRSSATRFGRSGWGDASASDSPDGGDDVYYSGSYIRGI